MIMKNKEGNASRARHQVLLVGPSLGAAFSLGFLPTRIETDVRSNPGISDQAARSAA